MRNAAVILALASAPLWAQPLTQGERDFAMSDLHATRKALLDSIAGLSQAQWEFQPAPDRWSIAGVAEHLVLSEDFMWQWAGKMLKSPEVAPRRVERSQDAEWLSKMADRSKKAQASSPTQPTGRWATPAALAEEFRRRRDRTIEYLQTTQDALRAHLSGAGAEAFDAYQMLLMISAHTTRHVAQINEVKAAPGYPK
jgi:uncharacterized damage-inducible protein DinB